MHYIKCISGKKKHTWITVFFFFFWFKCVQGILRAGRNCTQYQVEGKEQRTDMSGTLLTSCVWQFHQMLNIW